MEFLRRRGGRGVHTIWRGEIVVPPCAGVASLLYASRVTSVLRRKYMGSLCFLGRVLSLWRIPAFSILAMFLTMVPLSSAASSARCLKAAWMSMQLALYLSPSSSKKYLSTIFPSVRAMRVMILRVLLAALLCVQFSLRMYLSNPSILSLSTGSLASLSWETSRRVYGPD